MWQRVGIEALLENAAQMPNVTEAPLEGRDVCVRSSAGRFR